VQVSDKTIAAVLKLYHLKRGECVLKLYVHPNFGSLFHNQHPINTTTRCYILKGPIKEYCFDTWFVPKLLTVVEILGFESAFKRLAV